MTPATPPTATQTVTDSVAPIVCPACGTPVTSAPLERLASTVLYACSKCDLNFWYPRKMPDAAWYEQMYASRDAVVLALEPGHKFFLAETQLPKSGELLDVGCGTGNFLAASRAAGYTVTGIELDGNASRFAKEHFHLENVHPWPVTEFSSRFPGAKFKIVTFFEVLEHQADPREFLNAVKSCLAPGGWIALSVPNRTRWMTTPDPLDYPPNHFLRWSPEALRAFIESFGFEVLVVRQQPVGLSYGAQMINSYFRSGFSATLAGKPDASFRDVMQMSASEAKTVLAERPTARQQFVRLLARLKLFLCFPLAVFALPFLRLRQRKGLYLYLLARSRN